MLKNSRNSAGMRERKEHRSGFYLLIVDGEIVGFTDEKHIDGCLMFHARLNNAEQVGHRVFKYDCCDGNGERIIYAKKICKIKV